MMIITIIVLIISTIIELIVVIIIVIVKASAFAGSSTYGMTIASTVLYGLLAVCHLPAVAAVYFEA